METQRKYATKSYSLGCNISLARSPQPDICISHGGKSRANTCTFPSPRRKKKTGFLRSSSFLRDIHGHEKQAWLELYSLTIWVWITPRISQALTLTLLTSACYARASVRVKEEEEKNPTKALRPPPAWHPSPEWPVGYRTEGVPRPGSRRSPEHSKRRDSGPSSFLPQWE